jgi:hypothetical protein
MAKILTDKEMGKIIYDATHDESVIDDSDDYATFLEDLADLICEHFGGIHGFSATDYSGRLVCAIEFHVDEMVPADGGVFKDYDRDIIWKDGEEL